MAPAMKPTTIQPIDVHVKHRPEYRTLTARAAGTRGTASTNVARGGCGAPRAVPRGSTTIGHRRGARRARPSPTRRPAGCRHRGPGGPAGGRARAARAPAASPDSDRELAQRSSRAAAARARPDRVGTVGGEVGRSACPTTRVMNVSSAPSWSPAPRRARQLRGSSAGVAVALTPGGVGAPSYDTTRPITSVRSAAPRAQRPPYEWPNDVDRASRTRSRAPRRPRRRPRTRARWRTASVSPDAPRPRRSMAWTREPVASRGPMTRNVVWSAVAPWTRMQRRARPAGAEHGDRRPVARRDDADGAERRSRRGRQA